MEELIRSFSELDTVQQSAAGGKGGTLARLFQAGFPVPDGFIVLPEAFNGDELRPEAWASVKKQLESLRHRNGSAPFAVRSSALAEDSAQASFAGEFETVLDVRGEREVREAIRTVRCSRQSARVQAYSQAKDIVTDHEMAVVVQILLPAELSGVLFTADPITGSRKTMTGNYVSGFGDKLVSGETTGRAFTIERPAGKYQGPSEFRRYARQLFKLAARAEKEMGNPQDIEWTIAGNQLFLLQSRPITTLMGHNPTSGEWNDSLTGDFLWSNVNIGEAVSDVMTPLTWSGLRFAFGDLTLVPGYHLIGNIGGRPFNNISVIASALAAMGRNTEAMIDELGGGYGQFPAWITPPIIPVPRSALLGILRNTLRLRWKQHKALRGIDTFLAENALWCQKVQARVRATTEGQALADIWREEVGAYALEAFWKVFASALHYADLTSGLRQPLTRLAGQKDAEVLLSSVGHEAGVLASLEPVMGVWKIAQGEMTREAYLEKYGHRGPHEGELFYPRPVEDPDWLDQQIRAVQASPVNVDELLEKRRIEFEDAWQRLLARYPRKVQGIKKRLYRAAEAAHLREAVRSEFVRLSLVSRACALRAGEFTGLGDDVFFLYFEEIDDLLRGNSTSATQYVPARRRTFERYKALPPYPPIIRGRFDPIAWAADPERRPDFFDSHDAAWMHKQKDAHDNHIIGSPGSPGQAEGFVRRLDRPEDGGQLQVGEILVSSQTNIGWTLLFPRTAAVVTDVGAPLSHAAIVARELGIPAVVGCGDATMRLKTGDRVRVDGGRGTVEILEDDVMPMEISKESPLQNVGKRVEEWNDSIKGDYLWSNVNFGEAVTEVMTPLSWTVLKFIFGAWVILPGYDTVGNIGGRPYLNISLFASLLRAMGQDRQALLRTLEGTLFMDLPEELNIPLLPLTKWVLLSKLPNLARTRFMEWKGYKNLPAYLDSNPEWCRETQERIHTAQSKSELQLLWNEKISPHVTASVWNVMGTVSASTGYSMRLRRELGDLVGREDADALLSNLSEGSELLASLGPIVGIARLSRGEIDRDTFLALYGHRGPHEFELSVPRPYEDPQWLDAQLAQINQTPLDVDAMLARQRSKYEAAWSRFQGHYPRRARNIARRIREAAHRAQLRELARSEYVRDRAVVRAFALRAGELTGLGDNVFFLNLDEVLDLLAENDTVLSSIPMRRETYERYKALPPYPSIINGRFDPFDWAADPERRTDIFDSHISIDLADSIKDQAHMIRGSPGSAGRLEGVVRRLDRADEGDQLQAGEILVTMQTDIAWTMLFPRAAAVVTDVGAPLSHAAIVARELGIPAVVGCGDATMRLATGDRVFVDGGQGIVEIVEER